MKKATIFVVCILFYLHALAKCPWELNVKVYNNGAQVSNYNKSNTSYFLAQILPTDSVTITLDAIFGGGSCSNYILILRGPDTLTELYTDYYTLKLNDPGNYHIYYHNGLGVFWDRSFDIDYFQGTGLQTIAEAGSLQIYPDASGGKYLIKSDRSLKQIIIADHAGRVVIETLNNPSEIDLTKFSNGLYLYLITDDHQKVWRGKLLKI